VNKKFKINSFISTNKEGKKLICLKIKTILKWKIQSKDKPLINNGNSSLFTDMNLFKNWLIQLENKLFNNLPIIYLYIDINKNINKQIEINNDYKKYTLNKFLTNNNIYLKSTFAYILTKDDKGKNIFNVLHFNHETGYIVNNINIRNFDINDSNKEFIKKYNYKWNENFKLSVFIWDELDLEKENNNNNNNNNNNTLIQLSLNTLGYLDNISKSRKKQLLIWLKKIESNKNIRFKIINIAKYRNQECLQLFYIIYNNNPNTKIENLIQNYNALIKSKINKINRSYWEC